ncbi:MAG: hypothetical protein JSV89_09925 [Spirochaetaceae bacterium]|nr:MAG: hypothetical protein JSV89_09925 [Spirochaetaceae bacterium]
MKDILRLPILFLFLFVLLFILFFALSVLTLWGSVYSESREAALRTVEANIPRILIQVLPAAVLVSMIILLARIAARPGSRILSLLVPLAGAFVLLAFGYQILGGISPTTGFGTAVVEPTPHRYLLPGVFNIAESKVVYIEDMDEGTVSPVVLAEGGSGDRKLLFFPQGRISVGEDSVILRMAGYTLEVDPDPVFGAMFTEDPVSEDPVLEHFFGDIDFLNLELVRTFRLSLPSFYFAVLALVVAFYGGGMFLRLTRWLLLNFALALIALRCLVALFRLMGERVVPELPNPQAMQFLPELVLLVLGGLLLLVDLLFVPFHRWREE